MKCSVQLVLVASMALSCVTYADVRSSSVVDASSADHVFLKPHFNFVISDADHPSALPDTFQAYRGERFGDVTAWFAVTLTGTAGPDAARHLQIDVARVHDIEVWYRLPNETWQLGMRHGRGFSLSLTANSRPGVWLPERDGPLELRIRMSERSGFVPDARLMNTRALQRFSRSVLFAETLGFGLLLALTLYAGILLLVVNERVYAWMSSYCLSSIVMVGHHAGYGLMLFGPAYIEINAAINLASPYFVFGTFMGLARHILGFKNGVLVRAYVWGNLLYGVSLFLFWTPSIHALLLGISGLVSIAMTPFSLYLAVRGDRMALHFFIANLFSLAGGGFVWWAQLTGSSAADLSFGVMMYGIAGTSMLLVWLLAVRFRNLEVERIELQEQELLARRSAEEAASVAAAKSTFLATMSHEIRTPMNGVLGVTSLLADTDLDSRQREYLHAIERSGRSLVAILNDILDYSKFEQGHLDLEHEEIDLIQLADDVVLGVQHRCQGKAIQLKTNIDSAVPEYVFGDPTRLRQVLTNLVGNAIKFTESGHVCLSISMRDDGRISFQIEDTGVGIASEDLPKLFERFAQADRSITRRFGGTGLGLAICKLLIDAMGGEIDVMSQPGQGSRFNVMLPLARSSRTSSAVVSVVHVKAEHDVFEAVCRFVARWGVRCEATDEPDAHQGWPIRFESIRGLVLGTSNEQDDPDPNRYAQPLDRLRVLVAEDNPVNQLVVEKYLKGYGAVVALVDDGAQALERLEDETFDVVLMDCEMPVMDGYTATRRIRAEANWHDLPVIALTAHVGPEHRRQALEAGMNDYLTKPLDRTDLLTSLIPHAPVPRPTIA